MTTDQQQHTTTTTTEKISTIEFYSEYHGHKRRHLEKIYPLLRSSSDGMIWTAGDSSLDNKYWFHETAPAVGAYARILDPPRSKCDITYWLNYLAATNGDDNPDNNDNNNIADDERRKQPHRLSWSTINTSVEATTLNQRSYSLLQQDKFIRDNIQPNDILIVSVGGNDIALAPTPCTIATMAGLMCCTPSVLIERGGTCGVVPVDDYCCGFGPSLVSCLGGFPPCLGYLRHLFGTRVEKYVTSLTSKTKPKKILICMIYYLDERTVPSWAGPSLAALGYNNNPGKLQSLIRKMFVEATSRIQIPGTEVIPVPLFNVLDGKNTRDYIARVEPSATGGRKIAEFLLDIINGKVGTTSEVEATMTTMGAPSSVGMLRNE